MKIKVDNELLFELTETQKKVLKNDLLEEEFDEDMKRRLNWVIQHKYEKSLTRLKTEWLPKLKEAGIESIPLNDEAFAELVFSQPGYKNRTKRDQEEKAQREAFKNKI